MSDTYKNQEYMSCYGYDRITKKSQSEVPAGPRLVYYGLNWHT
jgi:hypothetical protein